MRPTALHWFRRKQRALARAALALFCLTWLQVAVLPCVMALDTARGEALQAATVGDGQLGAAMPAGMVMAAGEHCVYCPPQDAPAEGTSHAVCAFPHDPQVDSRVGLAAALMAPPPSQVLIVPPDPVARGTARVAALAPAPASNTPMSVSFCRFLK
jgi:hypothetical protein